MTAYLLSVCFVLIQAPKSDTPPPADFDLTNSERTAIFLAQWHRRLTTDYARGKRAGNTLEAEDKESDLKTSLENFIDQNVTWPLRIARAEHGSLTFASNYYFKTAKYDLQIHAGWVGEYPGTDLEGSLGREGFASVGIVHNGKVRAAEPSQAVEPWMRKLKAGDYVLATAKIKLASTTEIYLGNPTIAPLPAAPKKK